MERPKLLLADDSLTIQRVVDLTFADEGFDVVAVGDGDAALREIADAQPDIVLADVHMPGPSGYEICSLLRGIDETAKIPVILLVGQFEQFDPEEAEKAGADAFVTKPFQSIRQLVDQVRVLLAKNGEEQPTTAGPVGDAEPVPLSPERDTTDIDSLYERSFAETVEISHEMLDGGDPESFPTDHLDDESIETLYVSDLEVGTVTNGSQAATDVSDAPETSEGHYPEVDVVASLAEAGHTSSFEETLQMDAPPTYGNVENSPASMHTAPTEELRRDPFATTTDAFDLDDIDLLDLSTSQVDETYSFGTPTQSVEAGSSKQVVSISPELLDIIVRKVVEKLSEKY